MGPRSAPPSEAAPAYEDLFIDHERPGNTRSGYSMVPGEAIANNADEDIEEQQHYHSHQHNHEQAIPLSTPAANANTPLNPDDLPTPAHIHCEACDKLLERREKRSNERHCCTMVAVTFIIAFFCLMLLGIVIASRKKR